MRPSALTSVPVPLRSVPSPMLAYGCEAGTTEWIPTAAFATFSSRYNVAFKDALRKIRSRTAGHCATHA
jgi:hypothetical protein